VNAASLSKFRQKEGGDEASSQKEPKTASILAIVRAHREVNPISGNQLKEVVTYKWGEHSQHLLLPKIDGERSKKGIFGKKKEDELNFYIGIARDE